MEDPRLSRNANMPSRTTGVRLNAQQGEHIKTFYRVGRLIGNLSNRKIEFFRNRRPKTFLDRVRLLFRLIGNNTIFYFRLIGNKGKYCFLLDGIPCL